MLTSARDVPGAIVSPREEFATFKGAAGPIGLSSRPGRRGRVIPREALRDMRVTAEIRDLLVNLLPQLSYALEDVEVNSRYGQDKRHVSVLRNGDDTRHLLHIPANVLKKEENRGEFGLLRYMFAGGSRLSIVSPSQAGFPCHSYAMMVDEWKERDDILVSFINWKWLAELKSEPDLLRFADLFEPRLTLSATATVIPKDHPDEESEPEYMPSAVQVPKVDRERIVQTLAKSAASGFSGSTPFYRDLISRADLREEWRQSLSGVWQGDAQSDARNLVTWAIARGVNPQDRKYTTLGSILEALLDQLGYDDQILIVALIYTYHLYCDSHLLAGLAMRYQIPAPAEATAPVPEVPASPSFELREEFSDAELQGLLKREPEFLDVGFLSGAMRRAAGVCRVETADGKPLGTGFLLGQRELLTNYHVVELAAGDDLATKAHNLQFRFRSVTASAGQESAGQLYRPDEDDPVLSSSPVGALDYALIRVEEGISAAEDIWPVEYATTVPRPLAKGMPLNIIGHPLGEAMKLAISGNGIAGVYSDAGLLQYATKALNGSSGSPCFDDSWQLVAIHHAERARSFGAVREGVLLDSIYPEIRHLL